MARRDECRARRNTIEIIDLIISRYRDVHRRELAELILLSRRVERVHADHSNAPIGLADLPTKITDDLGTHMQKEEQVLFPMMRSLHPMVSGPIAVMRAEHSEHGKRQSRNMLRRLRWLIHILLLERDGIESHPAFSRRFAGRDGRR